MLHSRRRNPAARPSLESLELRALPSATPLPLPHTTTDQATHFEVITPRASYSGVQEGIKVVALDAANHVVRNYTGTVQLASTDSHAKLPASYTFTAADHGSHTFQASFVSLGSETISAADTKTTTIKGSADTTVLPAPVATHFEVVTPRQEASGAQETVRVVALDASNHVVTNYTGTVQLTSTDSHAKLPASYTFTAADHGSHTFQVTLQTAGSQTVTATDVHNASVDGSATETVKTPGPATRLKVLSTSIAADGKSFHVVVAAVDASGLLATGYSQTVHFTSSDSNATLPSAYTFTSADAGEHTFTVTLNTAGKQTLTVADNAATPLVGKDKVFVLPSWVVDPPSYGVRLLAALLHG